MKKNHKTNRELLRMKLVCISTVLLSLFYTTSILAQGNFFSANNLKGRVKSITESTCIKKFSAKKLAGDSDTASYVCAKEIKEYDKKGRLTVGKNLMLNITSEFKYKKGKLFKVITYEADTFKNIATYTYLSKNLRSVKTTPSSSERGALIQTLDDEGRVIKMESEKGRSVETMTYDENSFLTSFTIIINPDTLIREFKYQILETDEKGNASKIKIEGPPFPSPTQIIERKIEYYN